RIGTEVLRRDDVPATALRELLDDAAVAVRDDEHRRGDRDREKHRHVAMPVAERLERFLGAVRGRRQPVRAEPDPREERDERHAMEDRRIAKVLLPTEQPFPNAHSFGLTPPVSGWCEARTRAA